MQRSRNLCMSVHLSKLTAFFSLLVRYINLNVNVCSVLQFVKQTLTGVGRGG